MKVIVNQKNIHLNESQMNFINKKMEKLQRISNAIKDESSEIRITVSKDETQKESDQITVSMHVILPKEELQAVSSASLFEAALQDTKNKILHQLEKYKEKYHRSL